ncbi:crystal protein-like [Styela clava]
MFHTLSAKSKDLYEKSIQESNPAVFSYQTPDESLEITSDLTRRLCSRTESERECIMNANATEITRRQLAVQVRGFVTGDVMAFIEPYRPVIDGVEFTDQPLALYRGGKWNSDKSMIVGVNTEESDGIAYLLPETFPTGKTMFTIANYYLVGPGKTDAVVKKYEEAYHQEDGDFGVTFAKELSHMYFVCPSRALASFYANEHGVLDSLCQLNNNGSDEGCYFASHGAETRYVFRTVQNPTEADQSVEDQFSTYWGSFARTETPSNDLETSIGNFPDWPIYSPLYPPANSAKTNFQSDTGSHSRISPFLIEAPLHSQKMLEFWENLRIKAPVGLTEIGYEEDICEFWDSVGYYMDPIPLATTTEDPHTVGNSQPATPFIQTTSNANSITITLSTLTFIQSSLLAIFR